VNRSAPMRRSPLPQRSKPLVAKTPLRTNADISLSNRRVPRRAEGAPDRAARKSPAETGFSAKDRLLIRTRAGNGDPAMARCEATGVFLGLHGGEIQHIQARGMGGSRRRNNVGNGALLAPAAHALAESRDEHMHAMGFWRYSYEPPGPVMLHGQDGGVLVGLDDEGHYLDAAGNIIGGAR
jgi:hypothetical protein